MMVASAVGINFTLISPDGEIFKPADDVVERAREFARESGSELNFVNSPDDIEFSCNTDVVITDTHALGDSKDEKEFFLKKLNPYRLTLNKTRSFNDDWIFLHCMPIHYDDELADYVEVDKLIADGKNSRIFRAAENRLYAIMAVLLELNNFRGASYA